MEVTDAFAFLLGRWSVVRDIDDHLNRTTGRFVGESRILARPRALDAGSTDRVRRVDRASRASRVGSADWVLADLFEVGRLCIGAHAGEARRRLVLRRDGREEVTLFFPSGDRFVSVRLTADWWESTHRCGADDYRVSTRMRADGVVEERWRARGPAKDYGALTTLRRLHTHRPDVLLPESAPAVTERSRLPRYAHPGDRFGFDGRSGDRRLVLDQHSVVPPAEPAGPGEQLGSWGDERLLPRPRYRAPGAGAPRRLVAGPQGG